MNWEQRRSRRALLRFLARLGVKAAHRRVFRATGQPLTAQDIEELVMDIEENFGVPDQVFVSPKIFSTYFGALGNSSLAQVPDTEASGQSVEVPDDSRDQ